MSTVTGDAKAALRSRLRAHRRALASERDRQADAEALAESVLSAVRAHTAGEVCRVAAYEARPTEPPTHRLLQRLHEAGFDVVVPVMRPDLGLDWTRPGRVRPLGPDAVQAARVVVTPGLAANRDGTRLGQGGGSYDRALAQLRPGTLVVTLLYDDELLEAPLPVEAHDVAVDAVITPQRGLVICRGPG